MIIKSSFILLIVVVVSSQNELDLSTIRPTLGQPWPMPQSMSTSTQRVAIHPDSFRFLYNATSQQCDVLTNAFSRYHKLIFFPQTYWDDLLEQPPTKRKFSKQRMNKKLANLDDTILLKNLHVNIHQNCEQWPTFQSNESCNYLNYLVFSFFFVFN